MYLKILGWQLCSFPSNCIFNCTELFEKFLPSIGLGLLCLRRGSWNGGRGASYHDFLWRWLWGWAVWLALADDFSVCVRLTAVIFLWQHWLIQASHGRPLQRQLDLLLLS